MAFEHHAAAWLTFTNAGPMQYRIVTSSAYTGSILPMLPIHQNYTYTLTFQGPKLRCGDVKNQTAFDLAHVNTTNTEYVVTTYNATIPIHSFYYTTLPAEYAFDIWFATPMRNFSCETWNVTYTADFSFVNGEQSIVVTDIRYDNRFVLGYGGSWYYCRYDWCAYQGWHAAVASILTGTVKMSGVSGDISWTTKILQTDLIGCPEMSSAAAMAGGLEATCPTASLESAIEALSENATLSFFSAGPLL
jgi:hypothetical protein